jgi:dihydroorotate dehydrogenase (NAD+) catalytic subunit
MLKLKIKDITFNSPIIAASGTFGYGDEAQSIMEMSKIGCIITKSITLEKRDGNAHPRIHESTSGMLNSIGLSNIGVQSFCDNKILKLNDLNTHFIVSVAGTTFENYIKVVETIEKSQGQHIGYEINVSCPNVKEGGMEFGINKDMVYKLTSILRKKTKKLLFIKLSPNVTNIEEIALSAESAGADAISAVNTFLGTAINHKTGKFILSTKFGGLSGPAIKPLALAKIYKIYNHINIPIIGMGGITKVSDIIEFLRIGSLMVQIGTLNYRDPSIICKFYDQLESFLIKNSINNINDLVGNHK